MAYKYTTLILSNKIYVLYYNKHKPSWNPLNYTYIIQSTQVNLISMTFWWLSDCVKSEQTCFNRHINIKHNFTIELDNC